MGLKNVCIGEWLKIYNKWYKIKFYGDNFDWFVSILIKHNNNQLLFRKMLKLI